MARLVGVDLPREKRLEIALTYIFGMGGLPVRGQRTHTNARTRKGPRVAIAGKKKETK